LGAPEASPSLVLPSDAPSPVAQQPSQTSKGEVNSLPEIVLHSMLPFDDGRMRLLE
jgi:hypothetical protein